MICWRCHSNSVNTGSRLPICSDVKTRKRRNVVGIDMIRNNVLTYGFWLPLLYLLYLSTFLFFDDQVHHKIIKCDVFCFWRRIMNLQNFKWMFFFFFHMVIFTATEDNFILLPLPEINLLLTDMIIKSVSGFFYL